MQAPARQRIGLMAAALWWGSLSALGLVVVPMLFMHLGSPAVAGAMAARLFGAQTWTSTGCALLILVVLRQEVTSAPSSRAQTTVKFIVAGMLMALLVEFAVAPRIVSARADGGNLRLWHGLGSAMLLGQWLCAGFTLWRLSAQTER
ncbi:MAG: putative transrane protein [Polaromonas sp.]|jgi:hypothetical protein|nr:putative transrane protein [Polaromonas sp.]